MSVDHPGKISELSSLWFDRNCCRNPYSYFIKLLLEKKYALPYRVIDALVGHFMRFMNETRVMPVIWQQSLLASVESCVHNSGRYKNDILNEDKDNLRVLLQTQKHDLVTHEIRKELDNSRSRGEKEDDLMSIASPDSVMIKHVEEDMFDIPEVPMEDD